MDQNGKGWQEIRKKVIENKKTSPNNPIKVLAHGREFAVTCKDIDFAFADDVVILSNEIGATIYLDVGSIAGVEARI